MYFSPKNFVKANQEITLEKYKLTLKQLEEYGEEASRARERLKEAADYAKENPTLTSV